MGERGDPREYTCIVCTATAWGSAGAEPAGWCSIIVNGHGGAFCSDVHAARWFIAPQGWNDVVGRWATALYSIQRIAEVHDGNAHGKLADIARRAYAALNR